MSNRLMPSCSGCLVLSDRYSLVGTVWLELPGQKYLVRCCLVGNCNLKVPTSNCLVLLKLSYSVLLYPCFAFVVVIVLPKSSYRSRSCRRNCVSGSTTGDHRRPPAIGNIYLLIEKSQVQIKLNNAFDKCTLGFRQTLPLSITANLLRKMLSNGTILSMEIFNGQSLTIDYGSKRFREVRRCSSCVYRLLIRFLDTAIW